jgi:signal transduction histidine kinase/ActR/RegA family two-component response regulator
MRRGLSIRIKLIAISTLLMVGLIGLFSAMHTVQHMRIIDESSRRAREGITARLRQAGQAELRLLVGVTRLAMVQSDFITLQTIVRNMSREDLITAVAVMTPVGTILAHTHPARVGQQATGLLAKSLEASELTIRSGEWVEGSRSMTFVEPVELGGARMGVVFVAYSLQPLQAELAKTAETKRTELRAGLKRTLLVGLLALALGVGLSVIQGLRLARPIQELARQADKMAGGDLQARVKVRSRDEIGRLGERFNHMAGQIEELMREAIAKATMEKELELAEASRLAAIGRLAAGVAHEVNNPLTYAKVNLQLLARELAADEEMLELVQEALHGVGRIGNVVRQLSEFAQTEQGDLPGRVRVAVDSAAKMAMVQLKDRARLKVHVPELPQVVMDESKLAQVVLNLLVNSAQAIPTGSLDENWVQVDAQRTGDFVEITVKDTGSGIPEDALPHIFDSFFTTKEVGHGYGLGLSISRSLVQNAGGQIEAENWSGGGALFTVRLPVHVPAEEPARTRKPTPVPALREVVQVGGERKRLLLIDDDHEVLRSLGRMLDSVFEVTAASSGKQALGLLQADGVAYDVVLCDVMMPDGSGLEVVEALEGRPALLSRLVLMTGGTPGVEKEALARAPTVPVLNKPFDLDDLLRVTNGLPRDRDRTAQAGG